MDWECLESEGGDLWVSCTVVDGTTSPTHSFVRMETRHGPEHLWIRNNRVRQANSHKGSAAGDPGPL